MILAICNDPKILELALMSKTAISLLQFIAPLGVIIFAGLDILKAVTAKDQDGIRKQINHIPKRLIAMVILFFVPTFVDLTMTVVDSTFEYTSCFTAASKDNIESLYTEMANERLAQVKAYIGTEDWRSNEAYALLDKAEIAILNIKTETTRVELENKADSTRATIKQKEDKEKQDAIIKTELELDLDAYNPPDNSSNPTNPGGNSPGSGTVPYYNQCDSRWGSQTFYTGSYCRQSCGATSLAMVVSGIGNNSNAIPTVIGDKMKSMGLPATFVSHDAFTNSSFLSYFGIKGTRINGSDKKTVLNAFRTQLNAGHPIIVNLPGHYVVVDHIKDGKFHMWDPGTQSYNGYYDDAGMWELIINYKNRGGPRYAYFYFEKA
jgi:hypothetical protein